MRDERDEAVERVLAGLRDVQAPAGIEARIAERLERRAALGSQVSRGWRGVLFGSGDAGAWWRGAVAGAVVAGMVMGAVLVVSHAGRPRESRREGARQTATATGVVPSRAVMVGQEQRPCAGSGLRRAQGEARVPRPEMLRVESVVGPGPGFGRGSGRAFETSLTPEERGLVRLARTGDLQELASLDPEVRAKQEAAEAAEFQRFFARPAVKAAVGSDGTTSEAGAGGQEPALAAPALAGTTATEAAPAESTTVHDSGENE